VFGCRPASLRATSFAGFIPLCTCDAGLPDGDAGPPFA